MRRKAKLYPFCGSKKTRIGYDYCYYVVCKRCGANGPPVDIWTEPHSDVKAITAWNKRVQTT